MIEASYLRSALLQSIHVIHTTRHHICWHTLETEELPATSLRNSTVVSDRICMQQSARTFGKWQDAPICLNPRIDVESGQIRPWLSEGKSSQFRMHTPKVWVEVCKDASLYSWMALWIIEGPYNKKGYGINKKYAV